LVNYILLGQAYASMVRSEPPNLFRKTFISQNLLANHAVANAVDKFAVFQNIIRTDIMKHTGNMQQITVDLRVWLGVQKLRRNRVNHLAMSVNQRKISISFGVFFVQVFDLSFSW